MSTDRTGSEDVGDARELVEDHSVGSVDLTRWRTPPGRALADGVESASRRVGTRTALILTVVIGGVVAIVLAFVASRIYDAVVDHDGVAGLDRPILTEAMRLRSPILDAVVTGYTDIAGPIGMPIIAVTALLILSLRRRSATPAILIAAAGLGSLGMTIVGKDVIDRDRPPLADAVPPYELSPSFPSGHTLNAVVVIGMIAYLLILRRRSMHARVLIVTAAAVFALTVGLSRVFLGHHWFTDVLAGWVLGIAWLALLITAHRGYITARRSLASHRPKDSHAPH